jgi:hypothetical protein
VGGSRALSERLFEGALDAAIARLMRMSRRRATSSEDHVQAGGERGRVSLIERPFHLGVPELLALPASSEKQRAAKNDCANAGPYGDDDRAVILNRDVDRPDVGLMGGVCVGEATIHQGKYSNGDQYDRGDLDALHFDFSGRSSRASQ